MSVVDSHAHFIPTFVMEESASGVLGVVQDDRGWLVHPQGFRYPLTPAFLETKAKLAQMDALGIDISVISLAPTLFFYDRSRDEGVAFARRANDALAQLIRDEERLLGVATLPLQAPDEACAELERAVTELGLPGAQIGTSGPGGLPLDGAELRPILETAARLGVPLILHPYYVGPKPGLEDFYLTNTIGNPLDTCTAAARLMSSGVLDSLPTLQVVLVHGGGFLPYQLGRFDHAFSVRSEASAHAEHEPSDYLGCFWIDSLTHSDEALRFLAGLVGADHLLLGTDLSFDMADPQPVERLRRIGLDPHRLGRTAERLFSVARA